jgi:hypothetical protein
MDKTIIRHEGYGKEHNSLVKKISWITGTSNMINRSLIQPNGFMNAVLANIEMM